ncbi:unnamed protein product [Lactuca saligna]|uniref:RRM domain-containing protein n=1 Tax=Lactuca saligna TaxID=75948 RepID=A0AA35ZW96_LACSI|nr:unnamed protein product [Lactuca saligna]
MESQGEWQHVRRKKYGRDFDINGKAVTFFFQKFPSNWTEAALWKTFRRYGAIVDVYVAKKLNRHKMRFGFVRFIRITDVHSFENRLNGIYIGAQKVDVNVAKFGRKEFINRSKEQGRQNGSGPSQTSCLRGNKTFADVVKGINHPVEVAKESENANADEARSKINDEVPGMKTVKLISSAEVKEYMQNTLLVGEVENFQALMNVKAFQDVEGCQSIFMRYLGGLKMSLEFANVNDKDNFLRNGEEIWNPWFKTLKQWRVEDNHNERVASLIIQGVPQHAWCEEAFSIIAGNWGTVVIPEECATNSPNLAFGRVGIFTTHPGLISTSIKILVDGINYDINIMEDLFESLKLSPVLASNDYSPNLAWWNDGNGDSLMQSDDGEYSMSELSPAEFVRSFRSEVRETHVSISSPIPMKSPRLPKAANFWADKESPSQKQKSHNSSQAHSPMEHERSWAKSSPRNRRSNTGPNKSIDLNCDPSHSVSPRKSMNSGEENTSPPEPPHSGHQSVSLASFSAPLAPPSPRIDGSHVRSPELHESSPKAASQSTSMEVAKTIDIGEKVGFQIRGREEQLRQMIKNRGVIIVDQ